MKFRWYLQEPIKDPMTLFHVELYKYLIILTVYRIFSQIKKLTSWIIFLQVYRYTSQRRFNVLSSINQAQWQFFFFLKQGLNMSPWVTSNTNADQVAFTIQKFSCPLLNSAWVKAMCHHLHELSKGVELGWYTHWPRVLGPTINMLERIYIRQ